MSHPSIRAERRHERSRVIAKRRKVVESLWQGSTSNPLDPSFGAHREAPGKYAKWNLNCGSTMCHAEKYFSPKRKRREALRRAARDWECEYAGSPARPDPREN